MKCPQCREQLVKSQDEVVKIRSKILLFKGNKAYAVCRRCDSEIEMPQDLFKSLFTDSVKHVVNLTTKE